MAEEEEKIHQSTIATKKKRKKRPRTSYRSGYQRFHATRDLAFSLEHILTTGSKLQQDAERRREFRRLEEAVLEQQHCQPWVFIPENECSDEEDEDEDDPHNNVDEDDDDEEYTDKDFRLQQQSIDGTSTKKGARRKQILLEDFRIYGEVGVGKEGFGKPPWPKPRKKHAIQDNRRLNNSDKNWEMEHGDSIHPLAFAVTRLSEKIPSNSDIQEQSLNGSNLNISTTDTSLQEDEVTRALLLRCWERAVHASSQSIPVRLNQETMLQPDISTLEPRRSTSVREPRLEGDATSSTLFGSNILGLGDDTIQEAPIIPTPPPVKESAFLAYQQKIARDSRATEAKCIALGVGIPRTNPNLTCPICFQTFETYKLVRDHYYGGGNQLGCCWRRIDEKQTDVIAQVLDIHVNSQVNEFLGLVMECASERIIMPGDSQTKGKRRRLLNWHDILKFAEKTIHTSQSLSASSDSSHLNADPPADGTHPVLETLQRKSKSFPLCLNPTVLETVRQRLVDRYAKLPL